MRADDLPVQAATQGGGKFWAPLYASLDASQLPIRADAVDNKPPNHGSYTRTSPANTSLRLIHRLTRRRLNKFIMRSCAEEGWLQYVADLAID